MDEVRLLSPATNYAVVHLPGRQFPGVVFQGDSLDGMIADLEAAVSERDPVEREEAFSYVIARLRSVRDHYEAVLETAGMTLPYTRGR